MADRRLHLFDAVGIEIEYMIVDEESLDVRPFADRLLRNGRRVENEVLCGKLGRSNELAAHVVELKTNGPARSLAGLTADFQRGVRSINRLLASRRARLLPGGMHPWMDPARETRIWPHDDREIYDTFHRIFNCRSHGWSNLQSIHINLPFRGDDEFGRLHAAVRLVLPILPALAAASPVMDGRLTGFLDNRLRVYRTNCKKIQVVAGAVIPEAVFTEEAYRRRVLDPIRRAIRTHDPAGVLREEWVNARGAIARFDRGSIEIRLIDTQECPAADIAVVALVVAAVRALVEEIWSDGRRQKLQKTLKLAAILNCAVRSADRAVIRDEDYLAAFGITGVGSICALALWRRLHTDLVRRHGPMREHEPALGVILKHGPLARRMVSSLGRSPRRTRLRASTRELAVCLDEGRLYGT